VLLLVVESLLFGMFTMCMAFDQLQSATSGQTQIDRLKVIYSYYISKIYCTAHLFVHCSLMYSGAAVALSALYYAVRAV
jgi:hypothetical protein